MPILLTSAFNPGDLDPSVTYPRAKIVNFEIDSEAKFINMSVTYGNVDGEGNWVPGKATPRAEFSLRNSDYDDVVVEVAIPEESYLIYVGAKRVLYQWLIDNGHLAGTIE